ncbi:hypothetical protein ACFFX1_49270 [Dactylosporangium sucinum]|uniref:Uncharacterized protein n=1 Tax=Dactylosporangium sucinum TaxID=1424081 RepID=A0A917X7R7_9ACTN|nr:hypothetical protein [Dactylosporangium sucinum]GGM87084.1 hypothetical protein GCM10007977_106270 [Dactylosporangium sucinum]
MNTFRPVYSRIVGLALSITIGLALFGAPAAAEDNTGAAPPPRVAGDVLGTRAVGLALGAGAGALKSRRSADGYRAGSPGAAAQLEPRAPRGLSAVPAAELASVHGRDDLRQAVSHAHDAGPWGPAGDGAAAGGGFATRSTGRDLQPLALVLTFVLAGFVLWLVWRRSARQQRA